MKSFQILSISQSFPVHPWYDLLRLAFCTTLCKLPTPTWASGCIWAILRHSYILKGSSGTALAMSFPPISKGFPDFQNPTLTALIVLSWLPSGHLGVSTPRLRASHGTIWHNMAHFDGHGWLMMAHDSAHFRCDDCDGHHDGHHIISIMMPSVMPS